ncbi:MAG TPA: hypothetical protein VL856_01470 [Acidimicrobiia bacterium]|jgi:hypothetical protein|nr:hypothetical protein [Acidimicrobiia bacterium]
MISGAPFDDCTVDELSLDDIPIAPLELMPVRAPRRRSRARHLTCTIAVACLAVGAASYWLASTIVR